MEEYEEVEVDFSIKNAKKNFESKLNQIRSAIENVCNSYHKALAEASITNTEVYYKCVFDVVICDILKHFTLKSQMKYRDISS